MTTRKSIDVLAVADICADGNSNCEVCKPKLQKAQAALRDDLLELANTKTGKVCVPVEAIKAYFGQEE